MSRNLTQIAHQYASRNKQAVQESLGGGIHGLVYMIQGNTALGGTALAFSSAKRLAVVALTVSLLQWLVAFLIVGGEWFLMWQSLTWNGQEEAFRMFTVLGIVLLFVAQPDAEEQP